MMVTRWMTVSWLDLGDEGLIQGWAHVGAFALLVEAVKLLQQNVHNERVCHMQFLQQSHLPFLSNLTCVGVCVCVCVVWDEIQKGRSCQGVCKSRLPVICWMVCAFYPTCEIANWVGRSVVASFFPFFCFIIHCSCSTLGKGQVGMMRWEDKLMTSLTFVWGVHAHRLLRGLALSITRRHSRPPFLHSLREYEFF